MCGSKSNRTEKSNLPANPPEGSHFAQNPVVEAPERHTPHVLARLRLTRAGPVLRDPLHVHSLLGGGVQRMGLSRMTIGGGSTTMSDAARKSGRFSSIHPNSPLICFAACAPSVVRE